MARQSSLLLVLVVFLLVVSLGEAFALLLEYQNNTYLQRYVAENGSQVTTRIAGLLLLGVGASYLAYLASRTSPSSRVRGFSRRLSSLSPFLAGALALVLWFGLLSRVVGGSFVDFEIYVVTVLLAVSAWLMARDRVTVKMAVRNFTRRKTSVALVILGLMTGTAMISGSLVTGDTLTELYTKGAYTGYGYADEVVYQRGSTAFGYEYFNMSIYRALSSQLTNDAVTGQYVLGVTPEVLSAASVFDVNQGLVQAGATLIGTFSNASRVLGDFHSPNGLVVSSGLGDRDALVNDKAARDLNASIGDTLRISPAPTLDFKITGIVVSDTRGAFSQGDNVFVNLNAAEELTNHPGFINYIAITNTGGLKDSIQFSQTVGLAANMTLNALQSQNGSQCKTDPNVAAAPSATICAYAEKKVAVDRASQSARGLSDFFLVFSGFTVVAGIVLIVNIFVMIGEERKSEMGIARAVGMRRGHLIRLFLFEGSLYAALAAFVGIFAGIAIGYAILYFFGKAFTIFFPGAISQVLDSFTITTTSLFTAFTEGLIITYLTILVTSWRISKLNIIRAIRSLPEPPRGVRTYTLLLILGLVCIVAGLFIFRDSFSRRSAVETLAGPSLAIIGAGLVLSRFLRNRHAFTLTGAALLVLWGVPSLSWNNPIIRNYNFEPAFFFAGGVLMILGGILVVMYNTDLALRALRLLYRGRRTLTPIFKVALSYPENKRFRTAATVAMFALILFTVSATASFSEEQNAALDRTLRERSGGYDIIAQTTPIANLTETVLGDSAVGNDVAGVVSFTTLQLYWAHDLQTNQNFTNTILVGANPDAPGPSNFFTTNTFMMQNTTSPYKTSSDVWSAVARNSSYTVWSTAFGGPFGPSGFPNPGDKLVLYSRTLGGALVSKTVTIIGVLNGVFFNGIVASSNLLRDTFGVQAGSLGFLKVGSGVDPVRVSNILKREFLSLNMQTTVVQVLLKQNFEVFQSILALFEGFLGLGLVVGIAGLGILSIRSVVERRREIGILRALGFRRRMVVAAFLLESSYVALLGILIGVALGVNLAYAITATPNSGLSFVLPWKAILEIVGLSYGFALLATISSARRAASIPPAEALRYFE